MTVRLGKRNSTPVRPTDSIVRSGRRMLAIMVGMVRTRLNLLAVELMQERSRISFLVVLIALVLMFASMALLTLSLLVVVAFWEENRLLAIGSLLAFHVLATIVALLVFWQKAKVGTTLFASTLSELSRDSAALAKEIEADNVDFDVSAGGRN